MKILSLEKYPLNYIAKKSPNNAQKCHYKAQSIDIILVNSLYTLIQKKLLDYFESSPYVCY